MTSETVSIIGTAGGKETGVLTPKLFDQMVDRARFIITKDWGLDPENVILVSGGAAWSDHVAVELYLQGTSDPNISVSNAIHGGESSLEDSNVISSKTPSYGESDPIKPIQWRGLQIYFPCPWLLDRVAHLDNGQSGWIANPGRLANKLHTTFAGRMGRSTQGPLPLEALPRFARGLQADFFAAQSRGAVLSHRSGFHARNALVASSQYLIAFTFGPNMEEYRGGTAHTWNLCQGLKRHVSLDTLV
jgi:hypothetical protein